MVEDGNFLYHIKVCRYFSHFAKARNEVEACLNHRPNEESEGATLGI
jgi:hypothetical protein